MAKAPKKPAPPKKPAKIEIGTTYIHPVRGPREEDGRWYWRAVRYEAREQVPVCTGWGTPAEITQRVAELVGDGRTESRAGARANGDVGSVRHLLESWRADVKKRVASGDLAPGTEGVYKIRCEWLLGQLEDVRCARIRVETLEAYRDARLGRGAAPSVVASELNVLRIAWNWGQERELCPDRRLPSVKITPREVMAKNTPSRSEAERALAHLSGWPLIAARLYYATGARRTEMAMAVWRDLDPEEMILRVRFGTGRKTGSRELPLNAEIVKLLLAWKAGGSDQTEHRGGFTWGAPDAPILGVAPKTVVTQFGARLGDACKAAGVERITPHGFRRHAEDTLADAGVDPRVYADILGHSEATAIKKYRKSTKDSRRAAIQRAGLGKLGGKVVKFRRAGGGAEDDAEAGERPDPQE